MACDCLDKLGESLEEQYGNFYFKNLDQTIDTSTGDLGWSVPIIRFAYPKTLKNGEKSKSQYQEGLIGYNFCPICGTPFKEGFSRTPRTEQWLERDGVMELTIRAIDPRAATPEHRFVASMGGYGHMGSEDGVAGRGATIDEALKALESGISRNTHTPVVRNLQGEISPPNLEDRLGHFKSATAYTFVGVRHDTPPGYWSYWCCSQRVDFSDMKIFHRPISEFFDVVLWNGEEVRRFIW